MIKRFRMRLRRHATERSLAVWSEYDASGSGYVVLSLDNYIVDLTPAECAALEGTLADLRRSMSGNQWEVRD